MSPSSDLFLLRREGKKTKKTEETKNWNRNSISYECWNDLDLCNSNANIIQLFCTVTVNKD